MQLNKEDLVAFLSDVDIPIVIAALLVALVIGVLTS